MLSRVVLVTELMVILWKIIYNCSKIYKNKCKLTNSFLVKMTLKKSIPFICSVDVDYDVV